MTRQRLALYVLLSAVGAAAAVLSFESLRALATLCGFSPRLSWLLPVVVDAGAAASSLVWLGPWAAAGARAYGRTLAVALLVGSVGGNALGHGLEAYGARPHWLVVVGVSAIAPAVLGALVHLVVLVGRPEPAAVEAVGEPVGDADDSEDWDRIELPAPDSAIVAHLRRWAADRAARGDRPPSRDDMINRYRIGAPRATRIRRLMAWPTVPTAEPVEPTGAAR